MSTSKPEGTKRPYRLWDANKKEQVRYRYYTRLRNAHDGAYRELRWGRDRVGKVIEILNINNGHELGQYVRTPTSIRFSPAKKKGDDNA